MRISSIMNDPADMHFIPDSISLYILCLLWTSISEIMMPLHGCCRSKVGDDAAWRKAAAYIFENSCCSTRDENWLYHTWNPNSLMNKVDIKRGARSNSFLFIVTCFDFKNESRVLTASCSHSFYIELSLKYTKLEMYWLYESSFFLIAFVKYVRYLDTSNYLSIFATFLLFRW